MRPKIATDAILTRRTALGAALLAFVTPASAQERRVRLGQINLSFHAVTAGVVHETLLRLGHAVEVVEGPHEEIFPRLAHGEVDLLAATWLPGGHAEYWRQYAAQAVQLAPLYDGARLFWAVPPHVPESAVRSIEDLARPEVAARMDKSIRSIGPGAGLTIRSLRAAEAYGLGTAGYAVQPGPAGEWIANFRRAVAEGRWMVMPLWRPQFLNTAYRLRVLDDPKGILGAVDHGVLVARTGLGERLPADTLAALSRIRLGLDAVEEMDGLVNVEHLTPREAARRWMAANPASVSAWLPGLPMSDEPT